jgi:hypothetical protein
MERTMREKLEVARKQRPKLQFLGSSGVEKEKVIKIGVEVSTLF